MNTRVLVIDDSPSTKTAICDVLEEALRKNQFPNPEAVWLDPHAFPQNDQLFEEVERLANSDRWDSILVDTNLGRKTQDLAGLLLPFKIIEAFRRGNSLAMAFIYSGTIEKHLRNLFDVVEKSAPNRVKNEIERHLRALWHHQIVGFFERDQIVDNTVGELRSPPWMLKLEREAIKIGSFPIDWTSISQGIENTNARMVNFRNLSDVMRQQGRISRDIANLVMSYGIAAISEVYQLTEIKQTRVLFVTAECHDLHFVDGVVTTLQEYMPHLEHTSLQFHQTPHEQLFWIQNDKAPVVIFMLHGGDGYLKGADPNAVSMAPDGLRWMNDDKDRALIAGKAIYCFSCNSKTLGAEMVKNGAKAFIGFPDIPFYRFDDGIPRNEPELTGALQYLYARLTETVLLRWFLGSDTIEQMVEFVKLTVRKLTLSFVESNPDNPFRGEIVTMFGTIALGVMYEGDGDWVFPGG